MSISDDILDPRYTVKVNNRWFPDMIGGIDTSGSTETYAGIFGFDITALVIDNVEKYRVATENSGWMPYIYEYNKNKPAGDGSPILAVEIVDPEVIYMTHTKGGRWSKALYGNEDGYSGSMLPIDAIQILRL